MKPDLFIDDDLFDLQVESGLPVIRAFIGLFTQADREGRFKWKPRRLKQVVMPYDDLDFEHVLDALAGGGYLVRYEAGGKVFGEIVNWHQHQRVRNDEAASRLPAPGDSARPHRGESSNVPARPAIAPADTAAAPSGEGAVVVELRVKKSGTSKETTTVEITAADAAPWVRDFPQLDVHGLLRHMSAHYREAPIGKLWTVEGWRRGVVAWLGRDAKGVKAALTPESRREANRAGFTPMPSVLD